MTAGLAVRDRPFSSEDVLVYLLLDGTALASCRLRFLGRWIAGVSALFRRSSILTA